MRHTLFFTAILSFVLALIPHIVWLVGWLVSKVWHCRLPYSPFGWTALGLVLLCWCVVAYGHFVGRWQMETRHIGFSHPQVPASFDGYRIVHISDLHLSTFSDNPQRLGRIVDSINAQQPDLICFTGDLVTISPEEAFPFVPFLQRLHAKDGIVSILGNHDFFIYSRGGDTAREQALQRLVSLERDTLGWRLLRNEHLTLLRSTDSLTILGIDNNHGSGQGFSTINRGDLPTAMQGTGGMRVLLSHDPSFWESDVVSKTDIPLTLSGHTHAAQFRIGKWTPASWMFRQAVGRYDLGGQTIYVNAGIGCTVPLRIGCPSEITVITLKKK